MFFAHFRVGFNVKKYFKEEHLYKDRDSQIEAIEKTFEAAKIPVSSLHCINTIHPLTRRKYLYIWCLMHVKQILSLCQNMLIMDFFV